MWPGQSTRSGVADGSLCPMDPDAAKGLYVALWAFGFCGFCGVVVEMTFCYAQQY